jgi:glycosyltransferase involved in cell wall biosynthesis
MIEAADLLRTHPDVRIMFIGDGAAKPALMQEAQKRGLSNVDFLDSQPKELLPVVVGAADVCFSMLRPLPVLKGTMPVKLYEAMGAGRAILLAAEDGNASQIVVNQARAGVQVPPQDPQALADAILALAQHPEQVRELGQNGRTYVLEHFDRDKLVARLEERIEDILANKRGRRRLEKTAPSMR